VRAVAAAWLGSALALAGSASAWGQNGQEIRLWPNGAPGSEDWTVPESRNGGVITNVSDPTLTVYLPDPAIANGAAVVIAPGGALRALAAEGEGVAVAEWLNSRGIAGFVLKYRLLQQGGAAGGGAARGAGPGRAGGGAGPRAGGVAPAGGPGRAGGAPQRQEIEIVNANANPAPDNEALTEVLEFATADAQEALRLIRRNAEAWNIDPDRVGIMGFSAGGGLVVGTALGEPGDAYPNFLVSVYGPALQDVVVPDYAPPLFIAVGENHFNVTSGVLALFDVWRKAGKPAEIHVYDGVGGGFGISQRGQPVDGWPERFHEWFLYHGLDKPAGE